MPCRVSAYELPDCGTQHLQLKPCTMVICNAKRFPNKRTERDPCCRTDDAADCDRQESTAASEPFLFIGVLSQHDSAGESQCLRPQRRCKPTEPDVMCQPMQHTAWVCSVPHITYRQQHSVLAGWLCSVDSRRLSEPSPLMSLSLPISACLQVGARPQNSPARCLCTCQHAQSPLQYRCLASHPSRQPISPGWERHQLNNLLFLPAHIGPLSVPSLQATQSQSLTLSPATQPDWPCRQATAKSCAPFGWQSLRETPQWLSTANLMPALPAGRRYAVRIARVAAVSAEEAVKSVLQVADPLLRCLQAVAMLCVPPGWQQPQPPRWQSALYCMSRRSPLRWWRRLSCTETSSWCEMGTQPPTTAPLCTRRGPLWR